MLRSCITCISNNIQPRVPSSIWKIRWRDERQHATYDRLWRIRAPFCHSKRPVHQKAAGWPGSTKGSQLLCIKLKSGLGLRKVAVLRVLYSPCIFDCTLVPMTYCSVCGSVSSYVAGACVICFFCVSCQDCCSYLNWLPSACMLLYNSMPVVSTSIVYLKPLLSVQVATVHHYM